MACRSPLSLVGILPGELRITDPVPALGIDVLARTGTRPCRLRWSRSMGLPHGWPDIEGLALRLSSAGPEGGDADLLFASTCERAWSRYLMTLRRSGRFGTLTTLLPARAGGRAVTFRLGPEPEPRDDLPPTTYALGLALGTGAWQPVGHIDVTWSETDTADRFDPITRPLAARAVTRAHPTGGRHHA